MNPENPDKSWMLELVRELPGVRHAVVFSSDGLIITHTTCTDPDLAQTIAAGCSGQISVGRSLQAPAQIEGAFRKGTQQLRLRLRQINPSTQSLGDSTTICRE